MKRRISLSPLPASPVKSGEPFMMMAMREPPSFGLLGVRQHVQQEQQLAVADARKSRGEAARRAALVLGAHGVLVALPVLAVGRIGDQVVEGLAGVAVVGQRAAEGDVVGVAAGRVLHEEIGLRDRPGLGVHLLAEEVDLRVRVDRGAEEIAVLPQADGDVLLGDHQHAAGAAAGVVDGADRLLGADLLLVAGEHQVHHQVHHVARREVLARVLVQRLVELPDQLLEDRAHRGVVDPVRVQVDVLEALEHLEQQPRLVELADRVVEVELLQHLAHVRAEAGDVVAQVRRQVRRVGEELLEVVAGGVVEGEARRLPELRVEVLELLALELGLLRRAPSPWCRPARSRGGAGR